MGPPTTPGRSPQPAVNGVIAGLNRDRQPPGGEERQRLVPLHPFVPNRRDDLELGGQHPEGDIEADLIVSRAGGAVGDGRGPDVFGRLHQRQGLLGALRCDTQRIDLAPQHVSLNQEAHEPVVNLLARIDLMMLDRPDRFRLLPDRIAACPRGATSVHVDRVHRPPRLGQAGHTVGGVQPTGEGEREQAGLRMHIA